MKKFPWKTLLMIVVLGIGVFIVVEIWKAWQAGKRAFSDLITAPWTALTAAWTAAQNSSVGQGITALGQLPQLQQTELANAAQQQLTAQTYQPGGVMYQQIAASQGTAAADAAAAAAAQNAATEQQQAQADSSWSTSPWNPTTWFS